MPTAKKEKKPPAGVPDWMVTFADMVTLLMTFFVMMFTTAEVDGSELRLILAAFQGVGSLSGGNTLEEGKLAELGNTIMSLPSKDRGSALAKARKAAVSLFEPEIKTKKVRVTEDERGLVITLAADSFFKSGSADVDIENTRSILQRLSGLLSSSDLKSRKFRIECHTDSIPTNPEGEFASNWELSTGRAINTLHYLVDFGVDENQFQVAGLADTVPFFSNETPEGRAQNRRIDVIILSEGNL